MGQVGFNWSIEWMRREDVATDAVRARAHFFESRKSSAGDGSSPGDRPAAEQRQSSLAGYATDSQVIAHTSLEFDSRSINTALRLRAIGGIISCYVGEAGCPDAVISIWCEILSHLTVDHFSRVIDQCQYGAIFFLARCYRQVRESLGLSVICALGDSIFMSLFSMSVFDRFCAASSRLLNN
jgi:hypothetical protein